jgi:hypothetical protein
MSAHSCSLLMMQVCFILFGGNVVLEEDRILEKFRALDRINPGPDVHVSL